VLVNLKEEILGLRADFFRETEGYFFGEGDIFELLQRKGEGFFEYQAITKDRGITTLTFFWCQEIDVFETCCVEGRKIVRVEEVNGILSEEELAGTRKHEEAVSGSVLINEDEIFVGKLLTEKSDLIFQSASFGEGKLCAPGRVLEKNEAKENNRHQKKSFPLRLFEEGSFFFGEKEGYAHDS
jgi:hypothetical protein